MSTRCSGAARRSFIIGSRLCPPAITRASGPRRSSVASASSTLLARSYSNGAGTCTSCSSPPRSFLEEQRRRVRSTVKDGLSNRLTHDLCPAPVVLDGRAPWFGASGRARAGRERAGRVVRRRGAAAAVRRRAAGAVGRGAEPDAGGRAAPGGGGGGPPG